MFIIGCRKEISITKDYLPIEKIEFKKNISYEFIAKGGERHLSLIDWGEESIPVSSKSCHHGGEIIPPLKGFISANYDDKKVYIKVSWSDLTKDDKGPYWKNGKLVDMKDDGISIIFSKSKDFNCALTCHMTNWEIDRGKFVSDYRMFNKKEDSPILLIRPSKTEGKVVGGILGKEGKRNPKGSEFFIFNSKKSEGRVSSFYLYQIIGRDDQPIYTDSRLFLLNLENIYFEGKMEYRLNQWTADVSIPLEFLGLKDIKKGDKIYMSLAIFDGTNVNHSITDTFSAIFE